MEPPSRGFLAWAERTGATRGRGGLGILTWGGLLGGISVALSLSVPAGEARPWIVATTYGVVVFSILVQGLTVGSVARALGPTRSVAG